MQYNHLTHRTGLSRGILLNGAGTSVTDTDGAGNFQVGSFYLDFSGLGVFASDVNFALVDNEFTWVIADARTLEDGDNLEPSDIFLLDDELPTEEDGTLVDDDTRWLRIDTIHADLRFVGPTFDEAGIWTIDPETGEVGLGQGESAYESTLAEFLDANGPTTNIGELDDELDLWSTLAPHLRWSLHWALLVIDCTAVQDEGIADFATNNGVVPYATMPVPVGGPQGLLFNYGAVTTGPEGGLPGLRLWSPLEGSQGVRVVQRGERELKYQYRKPRDAPHPSAQAESDLDMGEGLSEDIPFLIPDASTQVEGANVTLNLKLNRRITVKDDQFVVLCVQTGRARLNFDDAGGNANQLIIAGPQALEGRGGPLLRLYHHAVRVTGQRR